MSCVGVDCWSGARWTPLAAILSSHGGRCGLLWQSGRLQVARTGGVSTINSELNLNEGVSNRENCRSFYSERHHSLV